jgi:hypothetical protein
VSRRLQAGAQRLTEVEVTGDSPVVSQCRSERSTRSGTHWGPIPRAL